MYLSSFVVAYLSRFCTRAKVEGIASGKREQSDKVCETAVVTARWFKVWKHFGINGKENGKGKRWKLCEDADGQ